MNLKKSKLGLLLALALVMLVTLAACGSTKSSQDNSLQKIKAKKAIVLGTSADAAPFEFPIMQNGAKKIVGYDVMVAKKIAKSIGVKLEIENIAFPSLISELQDKRVDFILAGMVANKQRKKVVAFSKPYHYAKFTVLLRKGEEKKFSSLSSFKGAAIGAQQSSVPQKLAQQQLKGANLVVESSLNTLTTELLNGKLDGIAIGKDSADMYVKKFPDKYAISKVRLKASTDVSAVSVAVRKSDKTLLKKINQEITRLDKNGQLTKMYQQAQDLQMKYGK